MLKLSGNGRYSSMLAFSLSAFIPLSFSIPLLIFSTRAQECECTPPLSSHPPFLCILCIRLYCISAFCKRHRNVGRLEARNTLEWHRCNVESLLFRWRHHVRTLLILYSHFDITECFSKSPEHECLKFN